MVRRPVKRILNVFARRATRRRVEGGAGSKRCMLGCDPAARQEAHRIHAIHTHLHSRIPMNGAPAPRRGAPPILAATLRAGTSFWPVAPGSRRKDFVLGAETGAERRKCIPGAMAPFRQSGLRLRSNGASPPKGLS